MANGERGVDSDGITNFSQYAIYRNIDGEELASRIDTRIEACDEFRSRTEIRETDESGSGWCCAVERRDKELMPDMLHRKIFSHSQCPPARLLNKRVSERIATQTDGRNRVSKNAATRPSW